MPTSLNTLTKPNNYEEELPEEKGLPKELAKDRTKTEVLLDDEGGLVRMSTSDYLLFQKLKKKCNSQQKTSKSLFEHLH
jgi:hypothetical protein